MKKQNRIFVMFILITLITFSLIGSVIALPSENPTVVESFLNNFKHNVLGIDFSIVGDNRACDLNVREGNSWELVEGQSILKSASEGCDSGRGLFNIFRAGWNPFLETRDIVDYTCTSDRGCNVELYCCESREPVFENDCAAGQKIVSVTCEEFLDWYLCPGEENILYGHPSYSYCDMENVKICYYKTSDSAFCKTRTYSTLTDCTTQTYMGYQLHNTASDCKAYKEKKAEEDTKEKDSTCIGEEEVFYTNVQGKYSSSNVLSGTKEDLSSIITIEGNLEVLKILPYFEIKDSACCEDLTEVYLEEKDISSKSSVLLGIVQKVTVEGTADKYKCVPEGEAGFCLGFAQKWMSPYTKLDCQANTIILIVLIILVFIVVLRFGGG